MSSATKIFQHLSEFGLINKNIVHRVISKFSTHRLDKFLASYVNIAMKEEHFANPIGSIDIYPDSESGIVPATLIRQLGMYANCFYLHDPLVEFHQQYRALDLNFLTVIATPKRRDRINDFKKELADGIVSLLRLKPLADASVVRFLPTALFARVDPSAIYSSMLYGPNGQMESENAPLPPDVTEFMQSKMRFLPAKFVNGALIIEPEGQVRPSNVIAIEVEGGGKPSVFCLSSLRVPSDESKKAQNVIEIKFDPTSADTPSREQFEKWIAGERERSLRGRMKRLEHDLETAARANASFLTTLPASFQLASLNLSMSPQVEPVLSSLLQLPLPYLDKVSLVDVARARKNEAAFEEFRIALRNALNEANAIVDENERRKRITEIIQDLISAPLARIDERVKSLNTQTTIATSILIGTFIAGLVTAGTTLIGTAMIGAASAAGIATAAGAAATYRPLKDDQNSIRRLPGYFYWELTKNARKK